MAVGRKKGLRLTAEKIYEAEYAVGEREGNQRGVMGGRIKEERGPKREQSK